MRVSNAATRQNPLQHAFGRAWGDPHLLHAARQRRQRGLEFGLHAAGGHAVRDQLPALGRGQHRPHPPGPIEHALHIGQEDELARAKGRRAGHCHLVGVHVVDLPLPVAGHAGYHRQVAVGRQKLQQRGVRFGHAPHRAQRRRQLLGFHQQRVDARKPHRQRPGAVEAGHQLVIDAAREDLQHGVQRFGTGDPQPAHKVARNAALGEVARHLLAAAMHHHHLDSASAGRRDLRRQAIAGFRAIEQRAAELDQNLHSKPSVSGSPSMRFMFWTAWPAAPFTRLSMALTTIARPVLASSVTPISQKLVRATPRRSGMWPGLYSRINGSPAYRFS